MDNVIEDKNQQKRAHNNNEADYQINDAKDNSLSELAYLFWIKRAALEGSKLTPKARKRLYLKTAMMSLLIIWIMTSILLVIKPTSYVSKWILILPGNGAGALVNLDSVGQATSSSSSPYLSSAIDPRENYKAISSSDMLMTQAAKQLKMSVAQLGKPKLTLPSQTGLMEFSVKGGTAQEAQDKGWALYRSLQQLLSDLRTDEVNLRDSGISQGLAGYNSKVKKTQDAILAFQSERGLVSLDQFKELALTIERLRHGRVNMLSTLTGIEAEEQSLHQHLGTSSDEAAALLKLHNDKLFQQLLMAYNDTMGQQHALSAHYGTNHPQITSLRAEETKLQTALEARITLLLRQKQRIQQTKLLNILMLKDIDGRAELMGQLIQLRAKHLGLKQQLSTLDEQIVHWEIRLDLSNDDAAKLEDLHRAHQLATAVMTSAVAKMDVGKADIFTAYPLLQLLSPPSFASKADNLATMLLLVAAFCASFMAIIGLSILWIRKPLLRKMLTKESSTKP
ncbi:MULTISPECIES: exopolysaccharide biosynthesis protein [unclassified Shewanella]|jgi:capsule polysaccharide export protein KpsE/RkpR|uniref:exopolysaccharide biosynthesis protein n=1 Tax=unclassified Shewanella TaxID=196818 RepID=UPI001E5E70AE|nr:exopolysaccharide biosynthesis protein [Shewanella sp. Actino-trap-3]